MATRLRKNSYCTTKRASNPVNNQVQGNKIEQKSCTGSRQANQTIKVIVFLLQVMN
jgi:hypothetical protein